MKRSEKLQYPLTAILFFAHFCFGVCAQEISYPQFIVQPHRKSFRANKPISGQRSMEPAAIQKVGISSQSLIQKQGASDYLFQQITNSPQNTSYSWVDSISADGETMVVISNVDHEGKNPDLNEELFLLENGVFTQITLNDQDDNVTSAAISGDGRTVYFVYNGDPAGKNADGNLEIFRYHKDEGITQLTQTQGMDPGRDTNFNQLKPSFDGRRLAFTTYLDLLSPNNKRDQIFLYEQGTGLRQLTFDTAAVLRWLGDMDAQGTKVVYQEHSFASGNIKTDVIIQQIDSGVRTNITNNTANGFSGDPAMSSDGVKILYLSSVYDSFPQSSVISIMRYQAGLPSQTIATFKIDLGQEMSYFYMNADGSKFVFASDVNILGGNSDGNAEIYVYHEGEGLFQLTNTIQTRSDGFFTNDAPAITADGNKIFFDSSADMAGMNPDFGEEIMVAINKDSIVQPPVPEPKPDPQPSPAPSPGAAVTVGPGQVVAVNNVFNPARGQSTTINYNLTSPGHVKMQLYTINGEMVKTLVDADVSAGDNSVDWTGLNEKNETVASGIYLLHVEAPGIKTTQKIAVIK